MTTTACPRAASSSPTRATCWLTALPSSQGNGVTCAMAWGISSAHDAPRAMSLGLRLGTGGSLAAHGTALDRLARVLGDELLGRLARLVVGALGVRRLHEVRAGPVELAADALV